MKRPGRVAVVGEKDEEVRGASAEKALTGVEEAIVVTTAMSRYRLKGGDGEAAKKMLRGGGSETGREKPHCSVKSGAAQAP